VVLGKLRAHKLYAKFSKCEFWLEKISFLGHILTTEGVAVDPGKVETVSNWRQPTNVSQNQKLSWVSRILPEVY
jgi:hypothetical protein